MSRKLETLEKSLLKKQDALSNKINNHFDAVRQTNGQPLNDKKNGRATLERWERQNEVIRKLQKSIDDTKNAIEKENYRIKVVENSKNFIPLEIQKLIEENILIQWRKFPHIFFVNGIKKARIIWDNKKKLVFHKFVSQIENQEDRKVFAKIYNALNSTLNNK